jgi:replicative DNA helicase
MTKKNTAPHNLQAEQALLGAMLLSKIAVSFVVATLLPTDFYDPGNGILYGVIVELYNLGSELDAVTVADELKRRNQLERIGGIPKLVEFQAGAPATANAPRYAKIIKDHSLLRELIEKLAEIRAEATDVPSDVGDFLDRVEAQVYQINDNRPDETVVAVENVVDEGIDRLIGLFRMDDAITGTRTGFHDLDLLLSGLQASQLIILGSRPAMGKTSLATTAAANVAISEGKPVLFFSLEMGRNEIFQRLLCSQAGVDANRIKNGNLYEEDWDKIIKAFPILADAPIWIDDNPNLNILEIRSKARRIKALAGDLGLIVVDYLQLMTGTGENRQLEISEISRNLKILSRELEVPVIALSQLNRGLENRMNKRPILADIRESGSLEQDADIVIFIYRDEIYNEESEDKGVAEVIIAKHRNGPTGTINLGFQNSYTRFVSIDQGDS